MQIQVNKSSVEAVDEAQKKQKEAEKKIEQAESKPVTKRNVLSWKFVKRKKK